jgi:DNA-binding transcriptional LysR family regulator
VRPPLIDRDGLMAVPLVDEGSVMVLPRGHPLAGRASAPLSALAHETFILFPRALNPGSYDLTIAPAGAPASSRSSGSRRRRSCRSHSLEAVASAAYWALVRDAPPSGRGIGSKAEP